MPDYGDIAQVKKMYRPTENTAYGADIDARLTAIQKAISRDLEYKLFGTIGAPITDTTQLVYAGPYASLILPIPARAITSVTVGGTISGSTITNGTLYTPDMFAFDPIDQQGRILGLRLVSGSGWGWSAPDGTPLVPVQIVGDFTDSDNDTTVPDDVTYAANLLILRTFQRETTGVAGVSGEDGTFAPPSNPWNDPIVKDVIARYRVPRVPGF
jgi:hypothetical protein